MADTKQTEVRECQTETQQQGLVIISVLLNFGDWLDGQCGFHDFLRGHSEGQNYFLQADDIAERLGVSFEDKS